MEKIVIVDYALGNIFNVQRALSFLGVDSILSSDKEDILKADKIILPGVGAFGEGMRQLKNNALDIALKEAADNNTAILGICLGMQLLMSSSEEHGEWEGLNLIPGKVLLFKPPLEGGVSYKIPQMGWNTIVPPQDCGSNSATKWSGTILNDIPAESYLYFVHSLYVQPLESEHIVAETEYGRDRFCSVVQRKRINGCQFHPERSGSTGIDILKNFLNLP